VNLGRALSDRPKIICEGRKREHAESDEAIGKRGDSWREEKKVRALGKRGGNAAKKLTSKR